MAETKKKLPDYQKVDGFTLPGPFYPDSFRQAINMKPRHGDIFLTTFPKCGTTWAHQMMYLIMSKGEPPGIEFLLSCHFLEFFGTEGIEDISEPRMFKIHLPFNLAPYSTQAKYIVVVRNPKDALVSFYHHTCTNLYDFQGGDFNDYFEIFIKGENDFGDYFDHTLSWYEHRNDPNVLYLYYEKMKADHRGTITQIAKFLGNEYQDIVQDETVLNNIVKYSSFEYMRETNNDSLVDMFRPRGDEIVKIPKAIEYCFEYSAKNRKGHKDSFNMIRKGIVGDWRNCFSSDQNRRMDEKIEEKLKGTELLEFWNGIGCL